MNKYPLIFFAGFLLITVSFCPQAVYANDFAAVLGVSTSQQELSIPPTSEGPGFILPDSPFFFLDQLKQQVRLTLAFTPEAKAKVHESIAGERLAELRFMLEKHDEQGIKIDFDGIADNLKQAANDVQDAQMQGKDVTKLAQDINSSIKVKQQLFDSVENQAIGETKAQVALLQVSLLTAKMRVEDNLPGDIRINEIENDIDREMEHDVNQAVTTSQNIDQIAAVLGVETSKDAEDKIRQQEDRLQKAVQEGNTSKKALQEKRLKAEKIKQEALLRLRKKAADQAKDTVKKTQQSAHDFRETEREKNSLKNKSVDTIPVPTVSPTIKPQQNINNPLPNISTTQLNSSNAQ